MDLRLLAHATNTFHNSIAFDMQVVTGADTMVRVVTYGVAEVDLLDAVGTVAAVEELNFDAHNGLGLRWMLFGLGSLGKQAMLLCGIIK